MGRFFTFYWAWTLQLRNSAGTIGLINDWIWSCWNLNLNLNFPTWEPIQFLRQWNVSAAFYFCWQIVYLHLLSKMSHILCFHFQIVSLCCTQYKKDLNRLFGFSSGLLVTLFIREYSSFGIWDSRWGHPEVFLRKGV